MKRIVIFVNTLSPHQLPLANEISKVIGKENFKYIYTDETDRDHESLNWEYHTEEYCWNIIETKANEWLEEADILLSGLRCFDLFERRAAKGLQNYYMTERWFKPPIGIYRLLHPKYFRYAKKLFQLMKNHQLTVLSIGIHAASDIARLCGMLYGDFKCIFCAPYLTFDNKPGGKVYTRQEKDCSNKYCLEQIRLWGYFVEESSIKINNTNINKETGKFRVLWVGRLLYWKRVDTIIRAVGEISIINKKINSKNTISLDIYGNGPEEQYLKKLSKNYGDTIIFHPSVKIKDVRQLMHEHDIYVLASNGYEGWGAVVNEALEEDMPVIGTFEAGSSATMMNKINLFHTGDWKRLKNILIDKMKLMDEGNLNKEQIESWNVNYATKIILN